MDQLYKQHSEDIQRVNQQWFNLFWRLFMGQQQQQTIRRKMNGGLNNDSRSSRRILLVDDDVDISTSLKIGLEDNGFIVDAFNDPLLALSNFKPGIYDLLLFDIRMPQLGSFDLYDKRKKEKNNNRS